MSTLTSKVQALLTYANGISGKADTTLGDAVKSLGDGFSSGLKVKAFEVIGSGKKTNAYIFTSDFIEGKTIVFASIISAELINSPIENIVVAVCGYNNKLTNINYIDSSLYIPNGTSMYSASTTTDLTKSFGRVEFSDDYIKFSSHATRIWSSQHTYKVSIVYL